MTGNEAFKKAYNSLIPARNRVTEARRVYAAEYKRVLKEFLYDTGLDKEVTCKSTGRRGLLTINENSLGAEPPSCIVFLPYSKSYNRLSAKGAVWYRSISDLPEIAKEYEPATE